MDSGALVADCGVFLGGGYLIINHSFWAEELICGVRSTTIIPRTTGTFLFESTPRGVFSIQKAPVDFKGNHLQGWAVWESWKAAEQAQSRETMPKLAHAGAPKLCPKMNHLPCLRSPTAITPRTWEVSLGLPSTALASRATTYKYLMSSVPFIRKCVNKNILWNWSPMQALKGLVVWGTTGFFSFPFKV